MAQTAVAHSGVAHGRALPGLRAAREALALSQRELAAVSGVHRQTIQYLEAGERQAWMRTVRLLATALRVRPAALYRSPGDGTGGEGA